MEVKVLSFLRKQGFHDHFSYSQTFWGLQKHFSQNEHGLKVSKVIINPQALLN